ncbi:GPW/gp25 family protein [Ureibacillus sp. FSL K6-2830]|uniref:GPW/gp25 family protein n=1 Tax=Ureibacillus sp. FSL K6-2830 TaxID=2954610 RepID=UPI0030FBBDC7
MTITAEVSVLKKINFSATGVEAIIQNVAFILSTYAMTCPLDREFGWVPDLDGPVQRAQAVNKARIVEAIQKFEPRAVVVSVYYEQDADDAQRGLLRPVVKVVIEEDE